MKIRVADAKNGLSELIEVAEGAQPVTVCRRGMPVVDTVRTEIASQGKPKFGTLRGRIRVNDPDWWLPVSRDEVDVVLGDGN